MKKKLIVVLSALALSCNSNKPSEPVEAAPEAVNPQAPDRSVACYEWTGNNDTLQIRLEIAGSDVSGTITYDYFQKDRNEGAIKGKLNGDIIIADYSFDSEGKRSVRQVAYKISGSDIIEGVGSMKEMEGKMIFTQPDSILFNPSFIIPAKECQ